MRTNKKLYCIFLGLIFIIVFLNSGCGILPKTVEFFQHKVKAVPAKNANTIEKEKQAIGFVDKKINQAKDHALQERSSTNIIEPLIEASLVSDALKLSLGPPVKLWDDSAEKLAKELKKDIAKLDQKLEQYRENVRKDEGKAIEGTGLIRMNYFVYVGGLFVLIFVLWTALKIYGMINPVVGLAGNAAKIPVKILTQGFKQVLNAGEMFKLSIDKKIEDPKTKELILELFRVSHERSQDEEVQNIIKNLTK